MTDIDEEVLQDLYSWVDSIPMSRAKKNIARDFSDGVLMAEVIKHYFPRLVELHSYGACNSAQQKRRNWHLLNWKVFKKLEFELSEEVIGNVVEARPGTIERVLLLVRAKMDRKLFNRKYDSREEVDTAPEPSQEGQQAVSARIGLEEVRQENLAKDETIEILQAKVRRLEHLLELKDLRIEELQRKLGELRPTAPHKTGQAALMRK